MIMKKTILISLFAFSLFAQNWVWQNPYPMGKNLNSVFAINSSVVFSAGDNGTILKSIDGGISWLQIKTGSLSQINAVYPFSTDSFIAVGENGTIFRTTDGGTTFSQLTSGTQSALYSIAFQNGKGFIAGANGTILTSSDNGASWTKKEISTIISFSKIKFLSDSKAILVGADGTIAFINSDGSNFSTVSSGTNELLSDVTLTASAIYVSGQNGTILKSIDNGAAWTKLNTNVSNWFTAVHFKDASNGIAVGYPGIVLSTSNGGVTWESFNDPKLFRLSSISFINDIGWVVGERGLTVKTTNFGSTWSFQSSGPAIHFNDIKFVDENRGWVVGDSGTILRTTNGGVNWFIQDINKKIKLNSIEIYPKNKTAYIAGEDGHLYKSTNSGESWFEEYHISGSTMFNINDVSTSPYMFRLVGDNGSSYVSFDEGKSWVQDKAALRGNLNASYMMFEGRIGYFVGDNGIINYFYRQWPSHTEFEDYSIDDIYDLNDVYFHNIKVGWIVGKYGIVLRANWTTNFVIVGFLDAFELNAVKFADSLVGYTVGSNGSIFKSTNSGFNWTQLKSGISNALHQCYFVGKNTGWVIGADGTILKTENGGGTAGFTSDVEISNPQLSDFALENNYPNPFNPATNIKFKIPVAGFVEMKIYDLLGNQVAAPVNGVLTAGEHSINFNANSLASGVYFCRLLYNGSSKTIKLTLAK